MNIFTISLSHLWERTSGSGTGVVDVEVVGNKLGMSDGSGSAKLKLKILENSVQKFY